MTQELGPNQRKWLAALRSGDYEQGRYWLCRNKRYCCLGVAYHTILGEPLNEGSVLSPKRWYGVNETSASEDLIEKLALRDNEGQGQDHRNLISMNDTGQTFAQIADAIESDPANWFTAPK